MPMTKRMQCKLKMLDYSNMLNTALNLNVCRKDKYKTLKKEYKKNPEQFKEFLENTIMGANLKGNPNIFELMNAKGCKIKNTTALKLLYDIEKKEGKDIYTFMINFNRPVLVEGIETVKDLLKENNGLYEMIFSNDKTKVYFDIDLYGDESEEKEFNKMVNEFKKEIEKVFKNPEYVESGNFGMSKKGLKHSRHIILNNYYLSDRYGRDNLKYWIESLKIDCIDTGVYHYDNQQLKCINQMKPNDKRIQEPINFQNDYTKHLVKYIDNENCNCADDLLEGFFKPELGLLKKTIVKDDKITKVNMDFSKLQKSKRDKPRINNFNMMNKFSLLKCIDETNMNYNSYFTVLGWCINENIPYNDFYEHFSSPWGYNEKFYNDWFNSYNQIKKWNINNFRREHIRIILEKQYGCIEELDRQKFIDGMITEDNLLGEKIIFHKKNVNDYLPNKIHDYKQKIKLFINGLGDGKTYFNIKDIKDNYLNKGKKVLIITNRRTLKDDILGVCLNMGIPMTDYLKSSSFKFWCVGNDKMLITSIESYYKYHRAGKEWDLLIIDEIESLYMAFLSGEGTIRDENFEKTISIFFNVLRTSKNIRLLDGILMNRTNELLKDLGHKEEDILSIYSKDRNFNNRGIRYYMNKGKGMGYYKMLDDMIKDIKEGKRVYFYYAHKIGRGSRLGKKGIIHLKEIIKKECDLKNEDFGIHFSSAEDNLKLNNVNEFWKDKKVIITTSCITVGVSFSLKDVFDSIWIMTDDFIDCRSVIQTTARIRHPKERLINLCSLRGGFNPNTYVVPSILNDFKERYFRNEKEEIKFNETKRIFKKLYKSILLEADNKDMRTLLSMFKITGIQIEEFKQGDEDINKSLKGVIDACDYENIYDFDNINDIDEKTCKLYERKQYTGELTELSQLELDKYHLVKNFKDKEDKENIKPFYMNRKFEGYKKLYYNNEILKLVLNYSKDEMIKFKYTLKNKFNVSVKESITEEQRNIILDKMRIKEYSNDTDLINKVVEHYYGKGFSINTINEEFKGYLLLTSNINNYEKEILKKSFDKNKEIVDEWFFKDLEEYDFKEKINLVKKYYKKKRIKLKKPKSLEVF